MKPLGFTVQQMRELLTAHDQLAAEDMQTRKDAERRLAEFAQQAVERCDELRDQLARAEGFARQLAAHTPRQTA